MTLLLLSVLLPLGASYVRLTLCVSRCVPKHRVCLSDTSDDSCHQFECVGRHAVCDMNQLDPMCDTDGVDHANLCQLHQSGKTMAYVGQCQVQNTEWSLQKPALLVSRSSHRQVTSILFV